ncbi:DNA alkylation repair protein [Gordonia sp. ABSL1-1]|uniref:DNA alkylation repair protein n=1 Tax=Gordonia sp. ABSL1-1 TaxID=3053923 RepID=UPI002572E1ED|nr:DNA alkylation repair protein [Gordonia sp. ABSL1-1]MDL9938833.1 DNA alkylation repair protein [Gordonia sp. ABSL1-1]
MTSSVQEVLAELAALRDPKARAINQRHGDDHEVNLSKLRAVAKGLKKQPELAPALWDTDDTAARLVAILICKPKSFTADQLDAMLRAGRVPKVYDWLISYVVKKHPQVEELRLRWLADTDPVVAAAGWALTADLVTKDGDQLDHDQLLDVIAAEMADAPERLQWAMNTCLGQIGIHDPTRRARVLAIGERLAVFRDYPTSPGCTSPYVPIWVGEMVRRAQS